MALVTVLYVFVKVSLFLPQLVEVRAFSILIVFSALSFEDNNPVNDMTVLMRYCVNDLDKAIKTKSSQSLLD